jgi:4-carboxymuconolactone decarboxylase
MSGTPTFGRYAEIPIDQMTPEQREGYRFLVDGPRGRLPGPYKVWVHNPKLVHAAAPLGQHFTPGQSSLTEREREIAAGAGGLRGGDGAGRRSVGSSGPV